MSRKLKTLREVHLYLSLISFVFLIFFCVTGIALNHQDWLAGEGTTTWKQAQLDDELQLQQALARWKLSLTQEQTDTLQQTGELSIDSPGKRQYLLLAPSGAQQLLSWEKTCFGWLAKLNELHPSRHVTWVWRLVSDVVAITLIIICVSGLLLSLRPRNQRRARIGLVVVGAAWIIWMAI